MTAVTGELRPGLESVDARRHDLDALRASAMLLGIVLHAALSFVDFPWVVQDRSREPALGLLVLAIHGFRMPVFFLLSGFFTAMLWRRYGTGGLLRHRAKRIALPLVLGCVTIVPATWAVMGWAESRGASSVSGDESGRDIWTAAAYGNLDALRAHVEGGAPLDGVEPLYGHSPLGWAVLGGQDGAIAYLLEAGADPNARYRDQNTALHTAGFFGRAEAVARLLEAGADVDARNVHGETPLDSLRHDRGTTEYIAGLLQVPVDFAAVAAGRERIREMLASQDATSGRARPLPNSPSAGQTPPESERDDREGMAGGLARLMQRPFFQHLWFLWFLCWLVAGFALVVVVFRPLPRIPVPPILVATPLCLLWLVPLTMVTQAFMHGGGSLPGFGADDSTGLVPMPHVLAHYAIFFGFGALMYGVPAAADRLGRGWWLHLSLASVVAAPALALALHAPGARELVGGEGMRNLLANLGQVLYAWLMIFGLMGLFAKLLGRARPGVRYLSDSSYWLYLAHLPLIIVGQVLVQGLDLPAIVKVVLLVAGATTLLLVSYQLFVRYTWIGRVLNGSRTRRRLPAPAAEPAASARC
jgi:peptidoglycan/LPS O-acetylase OafA/YrhL